MTIEEIEAKLLELGAEKDALREAMRALTAQRDELAARESAQKKLEAMSPAERKVLGLPEPQTVIGIGGIASEESVQG
jgi:hypothetical protein